MNDMSEEKKPRSSWKFVRGVGWIEARTGERAKANDDAMIQVFRALEKRLADEPALRLLLARSLSAITEEHVGGANRRMSNNPNGGGGIPEGGPGRPGHMNPTPANTAGVTVEAFWWGFHIVIPHGAMDDFAQTLDTIDTVLGAIAGESGPAAPFLELAAEALKLMIGLCRTMDHGNGIYFSMTWAAPGVFIPTPR